MFSNISRSMLEFIRRSYSPYHAVQNIKNELIANGYSELCEARPWNLAAGGKYFVSRNLSSIIAFSLPEDMTYLPPIMAVASHSDSPTFKIKKELETTSGGYTKLCVEKYGGSFMASWLDRPLSVAGKVSIKSGDSIVSKLVYIDRDLLIIPSTAIHQMRNINESFAPNVAVDMLPIIGSDSSKGSLLKLIAKEAGVSESDIIGHDLFLVNRAEGTIFGADEEFIASPKLDDLQCAYSSLAGFVLSGYSGSIKLLAVLDNEEVGNRTKQGADSTFMTDVIERIYDAFDYKKNDILASLASSFLVSADNAHAVHPNHPEFADANEKPKINGGVVIKYNANQSYSTDAESDAIFSRICESVNVPVQHFSNRADRPGGSTLGNIANTHFSVKTVDIGLAQLAMHSSYETAGVRDTEFMIRALKAFYSCSLRVVADGVIKADIPEHTPAVQAPALNAKSED